MSDSKNTKQVVENLVYTKALKDEAFRTSLKNDPKATLENELGVKIPDNVNINVVENSATDFYLVIPGQAQTEELTDEELSGVTGGWGRPDYTDTVCVD